LEKLLEMSTVSVIKYFLVTSKDIVKSLFVKAILNTYSFIDNYRENCKIYDEMSRKTLYDFVLFTLRVKFVR
jgi:hypothetical protein